MNVFAKFDELPSMILEVIKKTKRYGHTDGRSVRRSDNVKTVYPPTNTVAGGGGYNNLAFPKHPEEEELLRTETTKVRVSDSRKNICLFHYLHYCHTY